MRKIYAHCVVFYSLACYKINEINLARTHSPQETPQFSDSILCSSALIKRVRQLQIPDEDSAGGDYYQLTYPN